MNAHKWLARPIALAVSSCFGLPVLANPNGPQVMQGTAAFQGLGTNNLQVTNSPNAVIHWQGFSIDKGQLTNFVQQSASSAVLNRVVGADISQIHGMLSSNGRVFLINPAGILIGASGIIDTAGFVGSTLNMLDGDFLAGKLRFTGGPNAGSIINNGTISAKHGGSVVLVAPHIENSKDAIIQAPGGELLLAAGQKVTVGGLDPNGVQFEVQAPTDSVLNLGKLIADGGLVGVFAGTLKHSGDIRAGALTRDEGGRIVLKAQSDVLLASGSTTSANGRSGGDILIQSETGHTRVAGQVSAEGSAGKGGDIKLLGNRVSIIDNAIVDASGSSAGGQIRVGGDYQGSNPEIANAEHAFVGRDAALHADSREAGDGGRIIVWADKSTQYYGSLTARGGPSGGSGGFAEVSGKQNLIFLGNADVGAPLGSTGNLLLDPLDLYIDNRGGFNYDIADEAGDYPGNAVTISPTTLANLNANVTLFASRYMRISDDIALAAGRSFSATVAKYTPIEHAAGVPENTVANRLDIAANITTQNGAVTLSAPRIETYRSFAGVRPMITTGGGAVNISTIDNGAIASGTGSSLDRMAINALGGGGGAVTLAARSVEVHDLSGSSLSVIAPNGITTHALTSSGGAVDLTSTGNSVSVIGGINNAGASGVTINAGGAISVGNATADSIVSNNGDVTLKAGASVSTRSILAGSGNVDIEGTNITTRNAPGREITTLGTVKLNAKAGQVTVRVNNASSVTASSSRSGGGQEAKVDIDSTGTLNATLITATAAPNTCSFNSCPTASVVLSSSGGNVNVGSVTASAPVYRPGTQDERITESVNISATGLGNSILALPGSQVKATDVTLSTEPLMGGRIGGATALNVDVKRALTFTAHGAFNVALNGAAGPNQFLANLGKMPTGGSYTNSSLTGGGITLLADANDTTVTVNQLKITDQPGGFSSVVHRSAPVVQLTATNASLVAKDVEVPAGGGLQGAPTQISGALPVTLRAQGAGSNLEVTKFKRTGAANPSTLTLDAPSGVITLGNVDAASDAVTVTANGDVTFLPSGVLKTLGTINMTSAIGSFRIGTIDTSGGTTASSVNITASCAELGTCGAGGGDIFALANDPAAEISSAGDVTIKGRVIGNQGADTLSSFDITAAGDRLVTLTSQGTGGKIGRDAATPVRVTGNRIALNTLNGAEFYVNTGTTDLKDLSVTLAAPTSGVSSVVSNGRTYSFEGSGGGLELSVDPAASTQFANGTLKVELKTADLSTSDLTVNSDVNVGTTGALELLAPVGSILASGVKFDGKTLTLKAGTNNETSGSSSITTGDIGSIVAPEKLEMVAGHAPVSAVSRTGTITVGNSAQAITGAAAPGTSISLTTYNGLLSIQNGAGAPSNIISGGQGSVSLFSNGIDNVSQRLTVGDIFANSITLLAGAGTPTDGVKLSTGSLEATNVTLGQSSGSSGAPQLLVDGDIGSVAKPVKTLNIQGGVASGTVGGGVNVTGAIIGADAANMTINGGPITLGSGLAAGATTVTSGAGSTIRLNPNNGGLLSLGAAGQGAIDAGMGSTIDITYSNASPVAFTFARLNAPGGTVSITTNNQNIQQTGTGPGSTGITASTVVLKPGTGNIGYPSGDGLLDLNGVKTLTLESDGTIALDGNGSVLNAFSLTKAVGTDTSPFTLTGLGTGPADSQIIELVNTVGGTGLTVNSATAPLDFTFNYQAGEGLLLRNNGTVSGIVTRGGTVDITNDAAIDAQTGGINTTGSASPATRGSVKLVSTGGAITLGDITTPATARTGGSDANSNKGIAVSTSCANCDINVNGALYTGAGLNAGSIRLGVGNSGNIAGPGSITSESASTVIIETLSGNIGTSGAPLSITTPTVVLKANGSDTTGFVFADLHGTTDLNLTAPEGFNVTSDTPFTTLSLATNGTGVGTPVPGPAGTLNLTVTPGTQNYAFAHSPAGTFEIVEATGTSPLTSATFIALDGNLLVNGRAGGMPRIEATNLSLQTRGIGDITLQGNDAAPLVLANSGVQTFSAGRHINVLGKANISGGTQTFSSGSGNITFAAGTVAGESINVSATDRQLISTELGRGGDIEFRAGSADGTSVTVSFNGPPKAGLDGDTREAEQQIQAGGSVILSGGSGGSATDPAFVLITGNQRQLVRADGDVRLTGGSAANSSARIVNTGDANAFPGSSDDRAQQIGESRCFGFPCFDQPYQTNQVILQAGAGDGASVEIRSDNVTQRVLARVLNTGVPATTSPGTVDVRGGGGIGAFARIFAGGTEKQEIGGQREVGPLTVQAGSGLGSTASVEAPQALQRVIAGVIQVNASTNDAKLSAGRQQINGTSLTLNANSAHASVETTTDTLEFSEFTGNQRINVNSLALNAGTVVGATAGIFAKGMQNVSSNNTTMLAGTAANADALITSESSTSPFGFDQQVNLGTSVMRGGAANAVARVSALNGDQYVNWNSLDMEAGAATGAFVRIDALNGTQQLSGGNLTMTAKGDATTAIANASATIIGRNQNKFDGSGVIRLNGGAGLAGAGNSSDAVLVNLAGAQTINAERIIINGGLHDSTVGIYNQGSGFQNVSANSTGGISITGNATGSGAGARIFDAGTSGQSVNASGFNGPLTLTNNGIGVVDIRSQAGQSITGNGGIIVNANTSITSNAAQSFSANNGGINVNGTAAGNAIISAGTSQSFFTSGGNLSISAAGGGNASATAATQQTFNVGGFVNVNAAGSGTAALTSGGTQSGTLRNNGGIAVTSTANGNASMNAATSQDFQFNNSSLQVKASGTGNAALTAGTTQKFTSQAFTSGLRFVDVTTAAGSSGNATISAPGNQWFQTMNGSTAPTGGGSIGVAARGTGIASIDSGARQLLEVDYPGIMLTTVALAPPGNLVVGATDAAGTSRIGAVDQTIFARSITVQGGSAPNAVSSLTATSSQTVSVLDGRIAVLGGSGAGASAAMAAAVQRIIANNSAVVSPVAMMLAAGSNVGTDASMRSSGEQDVIATRGDIVLTGNRGAAVIESTSGPQLVDGANTVALAGGSGANAAARITTPGAQTINFGALSLTGGSAGAEARVESTAGTQTMSGGGLTLNGGGSLAVLQSAGAQAIEATQVSLFGGNTANAAAVITTPADQALTFGSLTMLGGTAAGASALIHSGGGQALTGASGITLTAATADAMIDGNNQSIACGIFCTISLLGSSGPGAAVIRNNSGDQQFSAGALELRGDPASTAASSVRLENRAATAQTITTRGDTVLQGRGSGTVEITSAGTQSIDARGLDVMTQSSGGANATVFSAGDQTIRTRGALANVANTGARVVSRSQGIARIQSGGNQVLNIDGQQLVVGSLHAFVPPTAPSSADYGVGDSLIVATNAISPASANQTITAGSLYIQGPSSDFRISKIAADTVQSITTTTGGVTLIGGSGTDTFAAIDPTTQSIDSFGPVLLQGGTGRNADAFITSTGPQSITSRTGSITLQGGSGPGADALITTDSPFQNVAGMNGSSPILMQGTGGVAGLQRGADNIGAAQIANNTISNELVREQNQLNQTLEDAELETENDRNLKRANQICR